MMPLTYVELFAGAGGLSRGLEMAGWECVAHAEWDAHARAVLRRHWPETPLFGDVSTLTGQMIYDASGGRPVTMLTGGSPCQDLSIAGKRAGMTEDSGTRSSLYFDQVRLWHELDAISPCPYLLWENVLGAFSSNHGKDFAAVLSALVGTPVAVPEDGWKGGGGVVSGCAGVAAWRVLDCQFFGPPQRRRRVFVLGVRAGGVDPAEVLSLLDSLSGDSESSRTAGQDAAPDAGSGVAGGGAVFDARGNGTGSVDTTLPGDHLNRITDYTPVVMRQREGKAGGGKGPLVSDKDFSLTATSDQILFTQQALGEYANKGVASSIKERDHKDATDLVLVVAPTLAAGAHPGSYNGQDGAQVAEAILASATAPVRPRRLMPIECERLMGWPDRWTERGTDEQGRDYALSDSARYKLCGNGVASPVAGWIGWRLRDTLEALP